MNDRRHILKNPLSIVCRTEAKQSSVTLPALPGGIFTKGGRSRKIGSHEEDGIKEGRCLFPRVRIITSLFPDVGNLVLQQMEIYM